MINFISNCAIPIIILLIIVYGLIEKNKVYDTFLDGAKEGIDIVFKMFPTLLGIFIAIGALRSSGLIEAIIKLIDPFTNLLKIPSQIMPLVLLRPISGSASLGIATDIMKNYGVDSRIGLIAATIMGSTETTFYTIALYTSSIGVKKIRYVLAAALVADFVGMIASAIIWNII